MPNAVTALYQLADKYSVPRQEIATWLHEHAKKVRCTYTIPKSDMELFKDSLEDLELAHYRSAHSTLCQALQVEKKEVADNFGKTVTLTVAVLT